MSKTILTAALAAFIAAFALACGGAEEVEHAPTIIRPEFAHDARTCGEAAALWHRKNENGFDVSSQWGYIAHEEAMKPYNRAVRDWCLDRLNFWGRKTFNGSWHNLGDSAKRATITIAAGDFPELRGIPVDVFD